MALFFWRSCPSLFVMRGGDTLAFLLAKVPRCFQVPVYSFIFSSFLAVSPQLYALFFCVCSLNIFLSQIFWNQFYPHSTPLIPLVMVLRRTITQIHTRTLATQMFIRNEPGLSMTRAQSITSPIIPWATVAPPIGGLYLYYNCVPEEPPQLHVVCASVVCKGSHLRRLQVPMLCEIGLWSCCNAVPGCRWPSESPAIMVSFSSTKVSAELDFLWVFAS